MTCEICHDEVARLVGRLRYAVCEDCAEAFDYHASLTPNELRAEERSITRYVDLTTRYLDGAA